MADEGMTTAVAAPETTGDSAPSTPNESAAPPAAETAKPDPYAALAEVDIDELIRRDPRLQGKIGNLAQQQSAREIQRIMRDRQAEEERQMEQARIAELRQLARNDPDKLAQETLKDLRTKEQKAREMELWQQFQQQTSGQLEQQLNDFYNQPAVKEMWAKTDDATRARLDWRNYGTVGEWNAAASDILADFKADKLAEAKARKLVEAAQKSGRVEAMADEASEGVDLGLGGLAPGGRRFRLSEINPRSPNFIGMDAYRKNQAAIEAQIDQGLLIRD